MRCPTGTECSDIEECLNEICEPLPDCVGDRGCEEGRICLEGYCRPQTSCSDEALCPDGFDCIEGYCAPALCRGHSDCPDGQLCQAGVCGEEADVEIASVVILDPPQTFQTGVHHTFTAVALDLRGDIVPTDRIFFETSDEAIVFFGDTVSLATMGEVAGTAIITAVYENEAQRVESRPVEIRVLAPSMEPGLRVHGVTRSRESPWVG